MGLNIFFPNAVINPKIPKFGNSDPFSENIDHPLKTIVKYRKYPSAIAILSEFIKEHIFFNTITIEDALKEISMFKSITGYRHTSIGIKDNSSFFAEQMYCFLNGLSVKENFQIAWN